MYIYIYTLYLFMYGGYFENEFFFARSQFYFCTFSFFFFNICLSFAQKTTSKCSRVLFSFFFFFYFIQDNVRLLSCTCISANTIFVIKYNPHVRRKILIFHPTIIIVYSNLARETHFSPAIIDIDNISLASGTLQF